MMVRVLAAALLMTVAVAGSAAPAWAHGSEASSTIPQADQVLTELPGEVVLEFSEEILPIPVAVSVLGPDGGQYVSDDLAASPTTVTARLSGPGVPGVYKVAYQVVFRDGAAARATYEFTIDGTPGSQSSGSSTAAEPGTRAPSLDSVPDAGQSPTLSASEVDAANAASPGAGPPLALMLIGGVALLGVGFALFARKPSG